MAKRKKNQKTATGRSPYKKYEKRETKYSAEYYEWHGAVKKGHGAVAFAAHHAWVAKWGVEAQRRRSYQMAA